MQNETIDGFRLSPQQERLWSFHPGDGDIPYRAQCTVLIEGNLDAGRLEGVFASVVERNEILRTSFHCLEGLSLPVQVVSEDSRVILEEHDLIGLDPQAQEALIGELTQSNGQGFDFTSASLLCIHLARLAEYRHTLIISLPALCADRAGLENLVREVFQIYEADLHGVDALPQSHLQYADISEWQNELLESEETKAGREFWRQKDFAASLDLGLPFEKTHGPITSFSPKVVTLTLDHEVLGQIKSLALEYRAETADIILACWLVLIWRLTGREEILTGVTNNCRTYDELNTAVGLLARQAPLTSRLDNNIRFSHLVSRCAAGRREATRWQSYFSWPQAAAVSTANSSEESFFPFVFEHAQAPAKLIGDGISFSIDAMAIYTEPFKVKLCCLETESTLVVEVQYDQRRYEREEIDRLSRQLECVVQSSVHTPEAFIGAIDVLGELELQQLKKWNSTTGNYSIEVTLPALFEAQVERTPEAVAVAYENSQLTYRELNERANQVGRYLQARGVGPDVPVAVMMERGIETIVALLAVVKAGGAYVPLDHTDPRERIFARLTDIRPEVVLTQQHLRERVPESGDQPTPWLIFELDNDQPGVSALSRETPLRGVTPDHLAYVIFTSGSTGQPKGVMMPHRAICNRLSWMQSSHALTQHDRVLQKTPLSFDASIWELFAPLISGATLIVARPGGHQDAGYLADIVAREQVTILQLVPTMLQVFLEEPALKSCRSLRRLFCGGEVLSADLQDRFFGRIGWARLHNLYGPTETAIDASHWTCTLEDRRSPVPIGRPISNVEIYALNEHMRPTPVGVASELFIGGAGLARGYHGQAALTAERFVPHPLSQETGSRLYRTGDVGRYAPDGSIEYMGRGDRQVKLRGLRIELGEIEAALSTHTGVQDSVVEAREDESGHKRLVAYVIPRQRFLSKPGESLHRLPNGLEVAHLNRNETEVIYREIFDELTYLRHGIAIKDGDCIFDVGANIGMFTLFANHVCNDARIIAFEPIPPTVEKLKTNVALYDLEVEVCECALSNEEGSAPFTFYPRLSAMSGRYADEVEDRQITKTFLSNQDERLTDYADEIIEGRFEKKEYWCPITTISNVIDERGIERVDLLKIDVEKSELDVIQGIREQDWCRIQQVVIEVHDTSRRLDEISGLLEKHGFLVSVEQDNLLKSTGLYNLYATRGRLSSQEIPPETLRQRIEHGKDKLAGRRVNADGLRRYLQMRLPDFMVPSSFVFLRSFPVTPNGKLDRRALPAPDPAHLDCKDSYVAPRTSTEDLLAGIWSRILGVDKVGIHDNFFNLGGDSILSIQIIARANQLGLRLTPALLFAHQTIAELASAAGTATSIAAEQGPITGELFLTPAQKWFFEQQIPERHHWNQAILLEARQKLDGEVLEKVARHLLLHHDAMRLRFNREEAGWKQHNAGPEVSAPLVRICLTDLSQEEQSAAIQETAASLQKSLTLSECLVRFVLFELGAGKQDRLMIVAHHLVIDGISWRILLEDLQTAFSQLSSGAEINLSSKTTSFKHWSRQLTEYAQSAGLALELPYWLDRRRLDAASLPVDKATLPNTVASARSATVELTTEQTRILLHEAPQAFNTQINDLLLTALVQSLKWWTGDSSFLIAMEGHGREEIIKDVNLWRTVGWFTTLFPVLLRTPDDPNPVEVLRSVKEQLRQVPNNGIGYGVLKYLCLDNEIASQMRSLPPGEISFNYLGQLDQILPAEGLFKLAPESTGANITSQAIRPHVLDISGGVAGGRLRMDWTYSENVHESATIERLAQVFIDALGSLIACAASPDVKALTPSDFPLANIDQDQLDHLTGVIPGIEDIYTLSPLQEGMLFHTLYSPESGMYMEQVSCIIEGRLDVVAFRRAWQRVVDEYTVLRTAFVWEGVKQSLQVVSKHVEISIEQHDWRGLSDAEQREHWDAYLNASRKSGFDPCRPPLMRLALARIDDTRWRCVWSFHHLLLDGWCVPILLREVFAHYEAFNQGAELSLAPARPYGDYIGWLQRQSSGQSERFWRQSLRGFTAPIRLGGNRHAADQHARELVYEKQQVDLSVESTDALQAFARQHQLTLYTVIQGAWALVLGRHCRTRDVVFGTVVSGRPVDLPDVETIVGPFINTLPVRVKIDPGAKLVDWLKGLQVQQVEARQHEHSALVQIHGLSEVPRGVPLFESLLTFENRPVGLTRQEHTSSVSISSISHVNRNNLPLTMVVNPLASLALQASYDACRFDASMIEQVLARFRKILESMPTHQSGSLQLLDGIEKQGPSQSASVRQTSRFNRLKSIKPKSVELSSLSLIKQDYLTPGNALPLVLQPASTDIDPINWAVHSREFIDKSLRSHGAILFRGFNLRGLSDFEGFAEAACPDLFTSYGDLPREETSKKVYKSTPYPADQAILFHNESSHMHRWPMKQLFYCVKSAEQGGETPIVDCRQIHRLLDPRLVARFTTKKLMYARNFIEGIDVSWQDFFKTSSRTVVEDYCRLASTDFEWKENGLKTRRICQAVARHPATGDKVFFNQIQLHHISCLETDARENLLSLFKQEDLPRNVYYGDGSVIENSVVDDIGELYQQNAVKFRWQEGDVLMLDNMLIAHGRSPFAGPRKIVVAMGQMMSSEELQNSELVVAGPKEK